MDIKIFHYEEINSTNLQASALLSSFKIREPFVVSAAYQTSGKGQGSHAWISEAGQNALASFVFFPPQLKLEDNFYLSMLASLAVQDVLLSGNKGIQIKWPNDILADGKKIAGILIENSLLGKYIVHTIIGIGLNVNQTIFPEFDRPATSLRLLTGKEAEPEEIIKQLHVRLFERIRLLKSNSFEALKKEYLTNLYMLNQEAEYMKDNQTFKARIEGIDSFGRLILQMPDGRRKMFDARDVRLLD